MNVAGGSPMTSSEHSQRPSGFQQVVILQPTHVAVAPDPAIPIMQETLLLLDLVVQEPSVDLREMSKLVLDDLGATLQILRLAGSEYGNFKDRPLRIEDCISGLGVQACMQAVSEEKAARHGRQRDIAEMWAHSREIAQFSRQIATNLPETDPEQAYLVGLLHLIGYLPSVLGWDDSRKDPASEALNGLHIAKRWSLPYFVQQFFSESQSVGSESVWSEIVRSAHHRATRSSVKCSFDPEFRPILIQDMPASLSYALHSSS
jgi:hypothetical protein